jgi:hypothetical protein
MAPILAAAAKRRREEEEEEMAGYLQEELGPDWEFKIVRGSLDVFGNSEKLRRMLEEEARSGWEMAGKLDNNRVFLRRPKSARERDHLVEPGIDPYRSYYGSLGNWSAALLIAGLLVLGVLVVTALMLARIGVPPGAAPRVAGIVGALIVVGIFGLLVAVIKARQ